MWRMIGMRATIKHIEAWKDRHGRERIYYRVRSENGKRFPLRAPIGSPEFWIDYKAAAEKHQEFKGKPNCPTKSDTLRWLVVEYYKSAMFKQLGDRTRYVRRGTLDRFCEKHGDKRFTHLQPTHLRTIRDTMVDRPEAANSLLKALRQVFKFATGYNHAQSNPALAVEFLQPKNKGGFHAWSEDEVEQYEATHPVGTKARLAFALFLYTGQRRGDVVRMGRQHIRDDWMTITQQKTGVVVKIPMLEELKRVIEASPTGDLTYIVSEFNRPFSVAGFGNRFRKWCDEAGLPQCSAHGLRKAMASRLAEMGCSTHEIMAIGGWETLKEVERYTKAAERKRLAGRVKERIDG